MLYGQRELMRRLYSEHLGDRERVLRDYSEADDRGEVKRSRDANSTSSREYAIRLWADGVSKGWLEGGSSPGKKRVTASANVAQSDIEPTFEDSLRKLGESWRENASRPKLTPQAVGHWQTLIELWCNDETVPLPIRKGSARGLMHTHPSGRRYVPCDNSPAHWAYMGCHAECLPNLAEVLDQMKSGRFPFAFARARSEKALIDQGTHEAFGGFLGSSAYGQVNRFPDGRQYKLCHIEPVGLKSRGEISDIPIEDLIRHVRLLLDPSNMLLVPLPYAGVGECAAFLDAFRASCFGPESWLPD